MKKLLFDESMPGPLAGHFPPEITVKTVQETGWTSAANGALLELAKQASFDVMLTADQSMPGQQNLAKLPLPVIILKAYQNKMEYYEPFVARISQWVLGQDSALGKLESGFYLIDGTQDPRGEIKRLG